MKKAIPPVSVVEVPNEGLVALLGKPVLLMCSSYFYWGILEGVNDTCVQLTGAHIVYETGAFNAAKFSDAQKLPTSTWYVTVSSIESFGSVAHVPQV